MPVLAHASGQAWAWHPHPDVWALIALISFSYWYAFARLGPRLLPAGQVVVTRRQRLTVITGIFLLWVASDYPVHDISENYLMSMHMAQHLMFTLVVPGILIAGTPDWLIRHLLVRPRRVHAVVSRLAKPLIAALIFNFVTALTHWPVMVNTSLEVHWFHFFVHALMFSSALLMWLPVLNRLPELPRMSYPVRMIYLFLQSILPTIPASFLTFAENPIYSFYETVPRVTGLSVLEDQQLAGGIMKVFGGTILWAVIVVMFFRWYAESQRDKGEPLTWDDVERAFDQAPATEEPVR